MGRKMVIQKSLFYNIDYHHISEQRTSESLISLLYGRISYIGVREQIHGEILMKEFPGHGWSNFHCTVSTYEVSRAINGVLNSFGASCHAMFMACSAATSFSPSDNCCRSPFTLSSSIYMALANFGFSASHR